jgi:hypothetical protein
MARIGEIPCFIGFSERKDRKNSRVWQGITEGRQGWGPKKSVRPRNFHQIRRHAIFREKRRLSEHDPLTRIPLFLRTADVQILQQVVWKVTDNRRDLVRGPTHELIRLANLLRSGGVVAEHAAGESIGLNT